MKLILCILGIFFFAEKIRCDDEWLKNIEECVEEVDFSPEVIGKPLDLSDPKAKCFIACIGEKYDVIKDGKIDEDAYAEKMKKFYPHADDSYESKIKECASEGNAESDKCEMAAVAKKCLMEHFGEPKSY
uniref:Odorant-binding protein 1 n=1 Tax=Encarsia formosa TaxID=32400 RepID=A0A514TTY6_ENCFO|nr:odorant-binding protein 1 [Encarsia formosa]